MTVEARWEPDLSKDNANQVHIKGLANNAQNPVKIRTNFGSLTVKKHWNLHHKIEQSLSNSTYYSGLYK